MRAAWNRISLVLLPGIVCVCAGCVDGPFGGLAAMNPYVRKKWEEDEKFGPTFHRRLAVLRGVKENAAGLDPAKKEEFARDMAHGVATEPNAVLRAEMVAILGELQTATSLPPLQEAVSDRDEHVRIVAVRALGRYQAGEALPVLKELMQREADVDVRLAVIGELARFSDPITIEVLGEALDDNDPAVQHLAVQSLKQATGRDYGDSVPAWREYVQGREPAPPPSPSLVERFTRWF